MTRGEIINFLTTTKVVERNSSDEYLDGITELALLQLREAEYVGLSLKDTLRFLCGYYGDVPVTELRLAESSKPPWVYYIVRRKE